MVKGKARAAGSFLGGIANNPGIVILGIVAITLFIFKDKISQAFASVGEGFGNIDITLPEIKFPDFPEIKFPDFPDFSSLFAGFQSQLDELFQNQLSIIAGQTVSGAEGDPVQIPPDTTIDPETGIVTSETPPTTQTTTGQGMDISTLFGELRPQVFDTLINIGISVSLATEILSGAKTIEDLGVIIEQANTGIFTQLQGTLDSLNQPVEPPGAIVQPVTSFLLDDPQIFGGGGVSFMGGSVFETPIANLTLNQIINMFNVTASQAANILAIAKDDFGDFDFGTNIGLGGFDLPGISGVNVSDLQFQGLTAEQIALILTGGNIQNF